jgi:hypothetical protein
MAQLADTMHADLLGSAVAVVHFARYYRSVLATIIAEFFGPPSCKMI